MYCCNIYYLELLFSWETPFFFVGFYCTGNVSLIKEIDMKWNSVGAEVGWCHDDCSDTGSAGIRQALPGKWHRSVPVPGCQELMESILKCKDCSVTWCIFSVLLPLSFCYI